MIEQAIDSLFAFVRKRQRELASMERLIHDDEGLNLRQREVLRVAAKHPDRYLTVEAHKNASRVVYNTARADLERLTELGYLVRKKLGRKFVFRAGPRLRK